MLVTSTEKPILSAFGQRPSSTAIGTIKKLPPIDKAKLENSSGVKVATDADLAKAQSETFKQVKSNTAVPSRLRLDNRRRPGSDNRTGGGLVTYGDEGNVVSTGDGKSPVTFGNPDNPQSMFDKAKGLEADKLANDALALKSKAEIDLCDPFDCTICPDWPKFDLPELNFKLDWFKFPTFDIPCPELWKSLGTSLTSGISKGMAALGKADSLAGMIDGIGGDKIPGLSNRIGKIAGVGASSNSSFDNLLGKAGMSRSSLLTKTPKGMASSVINSKRSLTSVNGTNLLSSSSPGSLVSKSKLKRAGSIQNITRRGGIKAAGKTFKPPAKIGKVLSFI